MTDRYVVLLTMVIILSPKDQVVPLPNGREFMAYFHGGLLSMYLCGVILLVVGYVNVFSAPKIDYQLIWRLEFI